MKLQYATVIKFRIAAEFLSQFCETHESVTHISMEPRHCTVMEKFCSAFVLRVVGVLSLLTVLFLRRHTAVINMKNNCI